MDDLISRTIAQEEITKSIALGENPHQLWQRINGLPSVTPKQKTGYWIKTQAKQGGISETWYNCSECGWRNALYLPRSFCPNCGARMIEL